MGAVYIKKLSTVYWTFGTPFNNKLLLTVKLVDGALAFMTSNMYASQMADFNQPYFHFHLFKTRV